MAKEYLENSIQDFKQQIYMLTSGMSDLKATRFGLSQIFEGVQDAISKEYYNTPTAAKYFAEELDMKLRLLLVAFNSLYDEMQTNVNKVEELSEIIERLVLVSEVAPVQVVPPIAPITNVNM